MGGGAAAVYSHQVCAGSGSFGGDSYAAGVIYMPCTNGVQALSYDPVARTFTPLWQGPKDAFGPPIVSGGLVWDVATGGFSGGGTKLYALDPGTGAVRYTETLPSPVTDHFASPSAGGGRVLVASGSTVSAFQEGTVVLPPPPLQPGVISHGPSPAVSLSKLAVLLHTGLHADSMGRIRLVLRCPAADPSCHGSVSLVALLTVKVGHGRNRHARVLRLTLARTSFGAHRGQFTVTLHLGRRGRALLHAHRHGLRVAVTISLPKISTHRVAALLKG